MFAQSSGAKDVIAVCNEFIESKILFADRKIEKILEAIAENDDVYNLIGECLAVFNKDKEFDKAFTVSSSGKGHFILPRDEAKIIALVFCLLVDINSAKFSVDEVVGRYFLNEEGKKDYKMFMEKVIVPFRDLIAEAFSVSTNITTPEAIQEMKEESEDLDVDQVYFDEEDELPSEKDEKIGELSFKFNDMENLERTFEFSKSIATQMFELLKQERKQSEEIKDAKIILNSVANACDNKDFQLLYALVLGGKYALRGVKSLRFLTKELCDVVNSQLYCD